MRETGSKITVFYDGACPRCWSVSGWTESGADDPDRCRERFHRDRPGGADRRGDLPRGQGGDRRNSGDLKGHQSGHGQLAGGQVLLHDPPGAGN